MVKHAELGLPPAEPYISERWKHPILFVKKYYGKYLKSCGAEENWLYQNRLHLLRPPLTYWKELAEEKGDKSIENKYGSAEWGNDLRAAIKNFLKDEERSTEYREKGICTISDIIKPIKNRTAHRVEALSADTDEAREVVKKSNRIRLLLQRYG